MKFTYRLIAFLFLTLNGCSDFSSETNEYELSGKMYACDESVQGDIVNDTKTSKKWYCNGYRWVETIPEDSVVVAAPDATLGNDSAIVDTVPVMYECENGEIVKYKDLCSKSTSNYLPLDDTEYPYAGIPRIVIETENQKKITSKENYISAQMQVYSNNQPISPIYPMSIKGHGNTTWKYYPKKPYTIKFNEKQSILNLPNGKKWILLANYRDRTLLRNATALSIAQKTDLEWTPSGFFAEIFLNGSFQGNYYVCEKINGESQRLNLTKKDFLLEMETYYDGEYKFRTARKNIPINIKHPDEPTEEQIKYIRNYIDSIECALYDTCSTNIAELIDLKSFADYLITFELTTNLEMSIPKSVYLYKRKNEPLKAGPTWDFDWMTFDPTISGLLNKSAFIQSQLLRHDYYKETLKEQWQKNKQSFEKIPQIIDSLAQYNYKSNQQNFDLWKSIQITEGLVGDENLSQDEAVFRLRETFKKRFNDLDAIFSNY